MIPAPSPVRIVEVGPRDGLQNEREVIPTSVKADFVRRLAAAGCREIEVTSFVRPDRVPQMADGAELLTGLADLLQPDSGVRLSALVPNRRGLERALAAGVRRIAVFTAASESFNQRNIGMSIRQSLDTFREIIAEARAGGVTCRGYVSTAFYCPYEGRVSPVAARAVSEELLELGVDEVSLGDTIGLAVPTEVEQLLHELQDHVPWDRLALHFHDTSGTALVNVVASLVAGIRCFDSSAGGLGGCPFAPGAAGNLATEDLVYLLQQMGFDTGVDLIGIAAASEALEPHLGHPLPGRQFHRLRAAGLIPSGAG
jgi:hydroxymethylglutaryl-CoA lyase